MKRSCGRDAGCAGPKGVSPRTAGLFAVLVALLVAGCGGIASPDLATGQVSGRLVGVTPGASAYVYALGKPETKVLVAEDGSYTVNGVPVGSSQLVAFDGETRADYIAAEVKPASRTKADDRDVSTLRPARRVAASVACSYGISADGVSYDVEGVALRSEGHGAQAVLFPVPPGVFTVRARAAGMRTVEESVDLSSATTGDFEVEMEMEVDDDDSHKGCLSSSCGGDLRCDSDGHCYACTNDAQCGAGFTCHDHECESSGGSSATVCTACSGDSQCASGPLGSSQPGRCLPDTLTCSHGCATNLDCPSGFACQDLGGSVGRACVPPTTCGALFAVFGTSCTANEDCLPIVDPKCVGRGDPGAYCSSRCAVNTDCPTTALGTYTCDPVLRVCLKP